MSESVVADLPRKVRPVSGILALLIGTFTGILYVKGYTLVAPSMAWFRLLHVAFASGAFLWGMRTLIFGRRRYQSNSVFNKLVPYRIEVTREGWLYFLIMITTLVGALIGKSNLLLLVFGLLAGPFVLNGHLALTMLTRNHVDRFVPERAMQGDWFSVDLTLSNRRWWVASWMMVVEDQLQRGSEHLFPVVVFTRVGPGQERTGQYQVRLQQRGKYSFGPIRLLTRFPLGLVERSYVMNCPGEVLVYPRLGSLSHEWWRDLPDADELVQQSRAQQGAFEDEFHRLREYRQGDSLRAVHWRTTARRNQLMVREHHQMRDQDLSVLVDLWSPPAPSPTHLANVELALSFAATLCVEHCKKSREATVFLGISGRNTSRWDGAASALAIPQMLDQFALADGGASDDLKELAEASFRLPSHHVKRVLITTRPQPLPGGSPALEIASQGAQRGMSVRVVHANPETLGRFFTNPAPTPVV